MSASSRDPRLLHVFPMFAPGGVEVRTARLVGELPEMRHTILATNGDTSAAVHLPRGAGVRFLSGVQKAPTWKMVPRLRRVISAEKPDLVLTYGWGAFDAALASVTMGLPVIHHEDGFNADEAAGFKSRRVLARRALFPRLHRVVVPSGTLRDIATKVWRIPVSCVSWIPNGIDGVPQDSPVTKADLGIPAEIPVIGFVGNLRGEKNVFRLLSACAPLEVRVLVIGVGPHREALEQMAQTPGLAGKIVFLGRQSAPWRYAPAIDVFTLSSDTEQMPISVLEAMACEKPVVSTDVGDVKSMLPTESRPYVVPFAEYPVALARLVADRVLQQRLGAANLRHVREHFAMRGMVDAYRALYLDALG